jgi:cytochrome d ubiquinol oxidase subunit I
MFWSFWILCNNSWMQVPIGHTFVDSKIGPDDHHRADRCIRWPHKAGLTPA